MDDNAAGNLATNIRSLRGSRNWSQQQLADHASIPRSTVASMESGYGNPSLANLARVSAALGAGIEELLARHASACALVPASRIPVQRRAGGRVAVAKLLPSRVRGMEIDRMDFDPGASMGGTPHVAGTKEYFYCLRGKMQVLVAGQLFELGRGDVLAFPGDQRHSYRNPGSGPAASISVVVPVPVGAELG